MLNKNKFKIRLSPTGATDTNIRFALITGSFDFVDYNEDNTDLLTTSKDDNVNSFTDGEKKLYKPVGIGSSITFVFNFFNNIARYNRYTYDGFSLLDDIIVLSDSFLNSFYVIQVYDTFLSKNQILLHTGYYNNYEFAKNFNQPSLDISTHSLSFNSESLQTYLPIEYVNSIQTDTFDLYFKFLFYNAKFGKFIPFFYKGSTNSSSPITTPVILTSEEDFYIKLTFTKSTKTYSFGTLTILPLNEFNNTDFNNILNSTVESISMEKPTYPSGNSFTNTGKYETLS